MPRKFEKASGRISLRIPIALHEQLAGAANGLGVDVNGLINTMLTDSVAKYLSLATERIEQRAEARNQWSQLQANLEKNPRRPGVDQDPVRNILLFIQSYGPNSSSPEELAEITGWGIAEVRQRIAEARQRLESSIGAERLKELLGGAAERDPLRYSPEAEEFTKAVEAQNPKPDPAAEVKPHAKKKSKKGPR